MHIMIANELTGEVVEFRSDLGLNSLGLKAIRGHVRQWMSNGLNIHQFNVLKWSDYRLWQYIREYAYEQSFSTCDCCGTKKKNSELQFVEDAYEVCLAIVCKGDCE